MRLFPTTGGPRSTATTSPTSSSVSVRQVSPTSRRRTGCGSATPTTQPQPSSSADVTASGWFGHDRWWLHLPGDDPKSAQFASAHESHHKQLQDSTSYGALVRVLA